MATKRIKAITVENPVIIQSETPALRTLSAVYQNNLFSREETKIFNGFMERFTSKEPEGKEVYDFLRSNPSIRRKLWDKTIFEY